MRLKTYVYGIIICLRYQHKHSKHVWEKLNSKVFKVLCKTTASSILDQEIESVCPSVQAKRFNDCYNQNSVDEHIDSF